MAAQQYRTLKGGTVLASPNPSIGYLLQGPSPASYPDLDTGPGSRTIAFADQYGTPGHEVYGLISVGFVPGGGLPSTGDNLTLTHGVTLSYGNLNIFGDMGGTVTLDGASTVTNDSTFTATGGRSLVSPFVLNGSMTVSNQSTADFHNATLEGHGTVDIECWQHRRYEYRFGWASCQRGQGRRITLAACQWSIPGRICPFMAQSMKRPAHTSLFTERSRRSGRSFHTATGTLDLLNKAGAQIASLQFAPGSREYTAIGPGNQFAAIATSPTSAAKPRSSDHLYTLGTPPCAATYRLHHSLRAMRRMVARLAPKKR